MLFPFSFLFWWSHRISMTEFQPIRSKNWWQEIISWTAYINRNKRILLALMVVFPNPFVPNAPFLYPLKTSGNRKVFWCFQGIEKGCIRKKWVKFHLLHYSFSKSSENIHEFHLIHWCNQFFLIRTSKTWNWH